MALNSEISLIVFLLGYLFAFGVSAIAWMNVDFSKFIKSEKAIMATTIYWAIVLISTYVIAHIIFDFYLIIT